ncbi:MAG: SDR family NAD(P)-dependent oxidoreductase [Paraburkholderia sp.]|uniref:SDR family NAD(P)-dependent oxidoreductase n=1 Tax=Paraburkholderia sp. TaxID=1926495 RepID=UPI0011F51C25|nr:SDR family NAD(P)-dependent oxidoreductase [Paraburkholderia sp.]TAL98708.1 MAG: SDR family NAD(P)-dependent oxidoreductase [Paraburkholderia sp.]
MKRDKNVIRWRADAAAPNLDGKQVAVIGGTGGIGRALSRYLASLGANVVVVGQTFRDGDVSRINFIKADLSLMSEAQRVAGLLPAETLDLVIFTTGIFAAPQRQETAEGIERDMAVSYLNRLVILRAIAPRLGTQRPGASTKPRVFVIGYPGSGQIGTYDDLNAEKSYKAFAAHMNTVAGNEMLVLDAAKRYPQATFFGLNPGLIKTNIRDNFFGKDSLKSRVMEALIGMLTPTADAYAKRIGPLLVAPEIERHSGALFNRKGQAILPSPGFTAEHIRKFLAASEALVARAGIQSVALYNEKPVSTSTHHS